MAKVGLAAGNENVPFWSVEVEVGWQEPLSARDLSTSAERLMETLEPLGASIATLPDSCRARVSIDTENPSDAISEGLAVTLRGLVHAGFPSSAVTSVSAQPEEELERLNAIPNAPVLLGVAEVADRLGVTKQRASKLALASDFPEPVARLKSGPVWLEPSVLRFFSLWDRSPGRPKQG